MSSRPSYCGLSLTLRVFLLGDTSHLGCARELPGTGDATETVASAVVRSGVVGAVVVDAVFLSVVRCDHKELVFGLERVDELALDMRACLAALGGAAILLLAPHQSVVALAHVAVV